MDIGLIPSQPVTVAEEAGTVLTYTLNKTGVAVRNVRVIVNLSGQLVHISLIDVCGVILLGLMVDECLQHCRRAEQIHLYVS